MKNSSYSLSIANPVYPVTNGHGAVIRPGTVATKIVRLTVDSEFISDFSFADLAAGLFRPGDVSGQARALGMAPKALLAKIVDFANANA